MMGNALLVRPLFQDASGAEVYFPAGRWRPLLRQGPNETIVGPTTEVYAVGGAHDYPVFLREGEIVVLGVSAQAPDRLKAMVFLESSGRSTVYRLHDRTVSGPIKTTRLQAERVGADTHLVNLDNGKRVRMVADPFRKGFVEVEIAPVL
jgi:alpha-glucosidase (family GH31 glycosyl hydrolase)